MGAARARTPRPPPADLEAALEVAFRYLAARPRSRAEIARRLRRAGTTEALVEASLERLARLGYVDDHDFARYWIEQRDRHAPRGRGLLLAELRRLGVDAEVFNEAEAGTDDLEHQRAVRALEGRLRGKALDLTDRAAVKRAADHLARRGFSYGTARAAIRSLSVGDADATEMLPDD